jgi:hypothetical protein
MLLRWSGLMAEPDHLTSPRRSPVASRGGLGRAAPPDCRRRRREDLTMPSQRTELVEALEELR